MYAMILSDNVRSRAYLHAMIKHKIYPSTILIIKKNLITKNVKHKNNPLFKNNISVNQIAKSNNIKIIEINCKSINNKRCFNVLKKTKEKFFIFSSNYGDILKKKYFEIGKKFIHIHPGKLPEYKGSTTFYYELLNENKFTFTGIFLNKKIDSGQVIDSHRYNLLKMKNFDKSKLDLVYDPYFRSLLLVKILKNLTKKKLYKKIKKKKYKIFQPYYIIHPVLKHLSILKK